MKTFDRRWRFKKPAFFSAAALLLAVLLAGCDENPVDKYGTGLVDTYKSVQPAADAASVSLLRQSIKAFRAAYGRYPDSLGELEAFAGTKLDSEKYDYNPSTGTIALK
jgi:hypothetical protein